MRHSASCIALLIVALAATTLAGAAIRRDPGFDSLTDDLTFSTAPTDAQHVDLESLLLAEGIDPDSNKAHIVRAWVEKIRHAPNIATGTNGDTRRVDQIFLDPVAREKYMSNGLAHLTPSDRLKYVTLLTRFLDELVPVNCFGLSDMRAVMNRISLREMTDSDVDLYFSLLFKVLIIEASNAPVATGTPQQYAAADEQLSRTLIAELHGDEMNMERYAFYASNPSKATASDVCWMTRVTLHAIIAMPDPERDFILLRTMAPRGGQDTSSEGQLSVPRTADPSPASSNPGSADAP